MKDMSKYIKLGIIALSIVVLSFIMINTAPENDVVKSSGEPGPNPGIETPQTYANNIIISVGGDVYKNPGAMLSSRSYGSDSDEQSNGNIISVGVGQSNTGDYSSSESYYESPDHVTSNDLNLGTVASAKVIISNAQGDIIRVVAYSHELYNVAGHWGSTGGFKRVIVDSADDSFYCIGNIRNQDYNATTWNWDVVVVKYNKDGDFLWDVELGGTGNDTLNDVYIMPSGQIVVYGTTSSLDGMFVNETPDTTNATWPFIVELSKTQTNESHMHDDDIDSEIALGAGGFGYIDSLTLVPYTNTGVINNATYNTTLNRHVVSFADDGIYYIVEFDNSFTELSRHRYYIQGGIVVRDDVFVSDGTEIVINIFDFIYNQTEDAYSLVSTFSNTIDGTSNDGLMIKMDTSLNVEWSRLYNSPANDIIVYTAITDSGKYLYFGNTNGILDGSGNIWNSFTHTTYDNDLTLVAFNSDGTFYSSSLSSDVTGEHNQYVTNPITSDDTDKARGIKTTSSGNVLLSGYYESIKASYYRMFFIKLSLEEYALNNGFYIKG